MKHNIKKLGILVIGLLVVLIFYLSYLNVVRGTALAANPYNRRLQAYENQIYRGAIYDYNGVVLAETSLAGEKNKRVYPPRAQYSPSYRLHLRKIWSGRPGIGM
ncbi:MAG: hypothetical protein RQM92_10350 [Candidatus Syntrophopropionicum ammoniitolerans]